MCGRYTLATPDPADVRARFPIGEAVEVRAATTSRPATTCSRSRPTARATPRGELLRWGLVPSWAKSPDTGLKMINARVETVAERPAYRRAFERFRCLIVADGFYEWQPRPERPQAAVSHHARRRRRCSRSPGCGRSGTAPTASKLRTCTILTTAANSGDRPAARPDAGDPRAASRASLARRRHARRTARPRCSAGLPAAQTALRPVGPAVNDARYDGPECLRPRPSRPSRPRSF